MIEMNKVNTIVRHPATWICGLLVVSAVAFQSGRANAAPMFASKPKPMITKPASFESNSTGTGTGFSLEAADDTFANLVDEIAPSVVHVRTETESANGTVPMSQGSGVIIRNDGWILTNDHVVRGQKTVTIILWNGKEYKGTVIESNDDRNDLAVVKIDANNLQAARFADSDHVRPGQYAIAVGAPFGLENTVTIGHISAVGRMNQAGDATEIRTYNNMIQTDAPINPGNSGGPLLNIRGELVGINTSIYSGMSVMGGGSNAGIGFAISSNQARLISNILIGEKKITRSYLNVQMESLKPYELEELKLPGGVRVMEVLPGGSAAKAGLKKGDIITRLGSEAVDNDQDLLNALLTYKPGETTELTYVRNGAAKTVDIKPDSKTMGIPAPDQSRRNQIPDGQEDRNGFRFQVPDQWREFFNDEAPSDNNRQQDQRADETPSVKGEKARLGVSFNEINDGNRKAYSIPEGVSGVIVMDVQPGSPAAKLGLKSGDVITRLGDRAVKSSQDLIDAVNNFKTGDRSQITYRRFSENSQLSFTTDFEF